MPIEITFEPSPKRAVLAQPGKVIDGKAVRTDLSMLFLAPSVEPKPQLSSNSVGLAKISMHDSKPQGVKGGATRSFVAQYL
ncbi:MAG: hypothetical protein ACREQ1_06870, partial [Woeseiaceae bacterium]